MKDTLFVLLLIGLVSFGCQSIEQPSIEETTTKPSTPSPQRIISLSGTLTEALYHAGLGNQLIAVDVTSTYPEEAKALENLGHLSKLNTESILALKPTLILAEATDNNNEVLRQLTDAGINVVYIQVSNTLESILTVLEQLGELTNTTVNTQALSKKIERDQLALANLKANLTKRPKVLFIYARGSQMMMVAGQNTFAADMIELAGGELALPNVEQFKPLTPEALIEAQPDAFLLFDSGLKSLGDPDQQQSGLEGLLAVPGVAQTPAGKNKAVYTFDGLYLSGFGPRASDAALELAKLLHTTPVTESM